MKPTIQVTQQKQINELEKENEILHAKLKKLGKEFRSLKERYKELHNEKKTTN